MLPIHTVLHPTDFSERSEVACRLACSLARDYGARLVLLHVFPAPTVAYPVGPIVPELNCCENGLRARVSRIQEEFAAVRAEYRLAVGNPAAEILRLALEINSDLIVMGTHGRTGVARALLGSVAEQVLREATCPVVTVKAPSPSVQTASEAATPAGHACVSA